MRAGDGGLQRKQHQLAFHFVLVIACCAALTGLKKGVTYQFRAAAQAGRCCFAGVEALPAFLIGGKGKSGIFPPLKPDRKSVV